MIGVPEERFWKLTPRKLKPYEKAYEMREERFDIHLWQLGQYVQSAVASCLSSKGKNKYIEKPFFTQQREKYEIEHMAKEEKVRQTEEFFKTLQEMQKRFEKSKGE